jgi:predicted transcriptional regulator
MKKSKPPKPTDAELAILRALWNLGPSTVRAVWQQINPLQETGYTTVLKTMQIMVEKGLLARDEAQRSHVYSVRLTEGQTQRQIMRHLLERLFSGSTRKLVMQALAVKKASSAELAEIRKLLDQMEGKKK